MDKLQILIIDDEEIIRQELKEFLIQVNCNVLEAEKPSKAMTLLKKSQIDIIFLDIKLPEYDGIKLLEKIKTNYPNIEIIIITGHGDMDSAIRALRLGAFDFLNKPLEYLDVINAVERTKKFISLQTKVNVLEESYSQAVKDLQLNMDTIIAESSEMKQVMKLADKAATFDDTTTLITGPSGVGKELVAKHIHYNSKRKSGYFCEVNCSAIPEALVEAEFFGHSKGAFTGAYLDKKGFFEVAKGGTLFLDEIGDMTLSAQAKVLKIIEDKKFRPVGSTTDQRADVRIICATNKDLNHMIQNGKFRQDLYYRLNVFEISISDLKKRTDDILPLIRYYIGFFSEKMNKKIADINKDVLLELETYDYPGNARELKNIIERAVILLDGDILNLEHFPFLQMQKKEAAVSNLENDSNNPLDLDTVEKRAIINALKSANYNIDLASKYLNISRFALNRRLRKYNIKSV